ncbi:LOW QUALITY PROTEIN: MADS-box MEF2 type transcription factor MIG1-like [Homalodisca vitripennis]|uniref:LOW QUALITY PROTEIN: MADS-box MEF2 type transcription factor MIG1-like n=1 Tax=Homalodisca vitripennis TaxID=197043 RepID=UPI001EEB595B|nr:LOW QUALITY PROTEIN: MADS-box MEF2 type transcription factor MIG1-like [Homalodisca vitripennis]
MCVLSAEAGYYKRHLPPQLPPAKLHYGHKPPPHFHHSPLSHNKPPPYLRRPSPSSLPHQKSPNTFPLDDDKGGRSHTIPAPNLSPADRPHHPLPHQSSHPSPDLDAVLRHGLKTVQHKPASSYQVTEDPSAHKPFSDTPSYFAPDPDPSLPTIEVPKTFDPYSLPSNGQQPLDLYQQQLAESQQHQTSPSLAQTKRVEGGTNSLSSQDLYNLLNGFGQQQPQMTAAMYQQYLLAAAAHQPSTHQHVYNAALLYPQQYQQQQQQIAQFSQENFQPQFETFNYNEQTQESAHGSDSFPSASSVSVGVKRAVASGEEEVLSNQVDYEDTGLYTNTARPTDSGDSGYPRGSGQHQQSAGAAGARL